MFSIGSLDHEHLMYIDTPPNCLVEEEKETTRKRNKKLTPEAQEIVSIRNKLGMSQPDFAIAVGESRDKIINIENGRLLNVHDDILKNARNLLKCEEGQRVKPLAELEDLDMNQILDRWKEMLSAHDDKEVAIILGTTMTTIERWRNENVRPIGNNLLRYELIAKKYQNRK